MASGDEQHRCGKPGQRRGDDVGDLHSGHLECLASHPHEICRCGGADDGLDQRLVRGSDDGPGAAHRVAQHADGRNFGPSSRPARCGRRVLRELGDVYGKCFVRTIAVAANVENEAVEAGGMEIANVGEGTAAIGFPAMHDHDRGAAAL